MGAIVTPHRTMKVAILFLTLLPLLCPAAENEFFTMDNGLRDVKTITGKAALLEELGYDGVTWRPGNTAEAVKEMSARGIKMHGWMMSLPVVKKEKAAPLPVGEIEALKGTSAIVWVQLTRGGGGDDDAARELHRLNAVAKPLGLRIAIYPHINNHVETLEQALRVADLVDDDNVGVSLTLCHQLKVKGMQDLAPLLKRALPKLFLVLVSGAEAGDTKSMGWDKLIQPLGQGSYDVGQLLKMLRELDYKGPVGMIGYGLKQPAKDHLKQSIDSWRKLTRAAAGADTSTETTSYYVDAPGGSDNHHGITAQSAWKSLKNVENINLQPGDKILLKAGGVFSGSLSPKGNGADGKPITNSRQ